MSDSTLDTIVIFSLSAAVAFLTVGVLLRLVFQFSGWAGVAIAIVVGMATVAGLLRRGHPGRHRVENVAGAQNV